MLFFQDWGSAKLQSIYARKLPSGTLRTPYLLNVFLLFDMAFTIEAAVVIVCSSIWKLFHFFTTVVKKEQWKELELED